jgi:hypothetical protein
VKQQRVTQKGKRSETKISNIILYYCGFRQERYSETALSEARYSGGYLYNTDNAHRIFNCFIVLMARDEASHYGNVSILLLPVLRTSILPRTCSQKQS